MKKKPTGIIVVLYTPQTKRLLINDVERGEDALKLFFERLTSIVDDITNSNSSVYVREDVI